MFCSQGTSGTTQAAKWSKLVRHSTRLSGLAPSPSNVTEIRIVFQAGETRGWAPVLFVTGALMSWNQGLRPAIRRPASAPPDL